MLNIIRKILITLSLLLVYISPLRAEVLSSHWIGVPKSKYGEQFWDSNNITRNKDGSVRVLSKFIPKTNNEITADILYTMDINCFEKTFRDVGVGSKEFNEFENIEAKWKFPNGDKLILGVIDQVCRYEE